MVIIIIIICSLLYISNYLLLPPPAPPLPLPPLLFMDGYKYKVHAVVVYLSTSNNVWWINIIYIYVFVSNYKSGIK